jgi:hypothetical protein
MDRQAEQRRQLQKMQQTKKYKSPEMSFSRFSPICHLAYTKPVMYTRVPELSWGTHPAYLLQIGHSGLTGNDADHPHSILPFLVAAALLGGRKQPCTI